MDWLIILLQNDIMLRYSFLRPYLYNAMVIPVSEVAAMTYVRKQMSLQPNDNEIFIFVSNQKLTVTQSSYI